MEEVNGMKSTACLKFSKMLYALFTLGVAATPILDWSQIISLVVLSMVRPH